MRPRQKGEGFSHSLTDLMTSIAVIFILLFLLFVRNEQQEMAVQKKETASNRDLLLEELKEHVGGEGVAVASDPNDPLTVLVVLTDRPDLLGFGFREDIVRPQARSFLDWFVPRLLKVICADGREEMIDSVIVEGHTDSQGGHDFNTDLSARRATAVLVAARQILERYDRDAQVKPPGLETCFLHLAQATGRGKQKLEKNADGSENAAASRRVVVKVRVKSLEQRQAVADVIPVSEEDPDA
jgi:outer membrane protein OmpA-like peptidoglycan-associated protein